MHRNQNGLNATALHSGRSRQVRAYFRDGPKKGVLAVSKCVVPFSLFAGYHTGEDLKGIFSLIKSSGLKPENTYYILGDGLQAYNLAMADESLDPDSQVARTTAHRLGDDWIAKNAEVLQGIDIYRWQDLVCNTEFQDEKEKFFAFYNETSVLASEFRDGINKTASEVFDRFKRRQVEGFPNEERARELGVRFVLEECALFFVFAKNNAINYMAYPSVLPASLDVTKRFFLRDDNLLKWLPIKVKELREPSLVNDAAVVDSASYAASADTTTTSSDSEGSASDNVQVRDESKPTELEACAKSLVFQVNGLIDGLVHGGLVRREHRNALIATLIRSLESLPADSNQGITFSISIPPVVAPMAVGAPRTSARPS